VRQRERARESSHAVRQREEEGWCINGIYISLKA
jgi:hypothetical protein